MAGLKVIRPVSAVWGFGVFVTVYWWKILLQPVAW
jgi:hypothetical protein